MTRRSALTALAAVPCAASLARNAADERPVALTRAYRTSADGGRWGTTHALDVPLVFDNVAASTAMLGSDDAAQSVAYAMSAAWAAFARIGSPGWPPYDSAARLTMVFDRESRARSDLDADQRKLLGGPPVNILAPAT